jgi:hypothetical protein
MIDRPVSIDTAIVSQQHTEDIKDLILTIRGEQVLLDSDVAMLYGYETRSINQAASRNKKRFPPEFRFQLTDEEVEEILTSQFVMSKSTIQSEADKRGGRRHRPYVFTEMGIGMLSGILKNDTAVQVSLGIMRAFVEMRKFISANRDVFAKIVQIDSKLLEHDRKFDEVFDLLQQPEPVKQSIFYKGELYGALALITSFIKKAHTSITIIDNYATSSVLDMLTEKQLDVAITIITANPDMISRQRQQAYTAQYGALRIVENHDFHDRFIIVDDKDVYAVGASLKDAGRKCFEVSKNEDTARFLAYVQSVIV